MRETTNEGISIDYAMKPSIYNHFFRDIRGGVAKALDGVDVVVAEEFAISDNVDDGLSIHLTE